MTLRHALSLPLLFALASSCRYRPAHFADRKTVTAVSDDAPEPVPGTHNFDEREHVSDIYLRRPLFDLAEAREFPTAGDVNAIDEVAASTWFTPDPLTPAEWAKSVAKTGPPEAPLVAVDEDPLTVDGALVIHDGRGLRYELVADPVEHPGLRTAADLVAGHLLRGLGLNAPSAFLVERAQLELPPGTIASRPAARLSEWVARAGARSGAPIRVSATRWPEGIDVGITTDFETRRDDPNDVVAHQDRRSLRAMKVFGHWLGWGGFGVRSTRDVYVGKPGEGHLVHSFVAESRSLGTEDLHPEREADRGTFWMNLLTLGLTRPRVAVARPPTDPALGFLPPEIVPASYDVSPSYSPFVRATPADRYWAAKRLMLLGDEALSGAIAAARLPAIAAAMLHETLRRRRHILITDGMDAVTPVDPAATAGKSVWLTDRAISARIASARDTRYDVAFLDDRGANRAPKRRVDAAGSVTAIELPAQLDGLVVLRIRVTRKGKEAPRACDIHVIVEHGEARFLAVRH